MGKYVIAKYIRLSLEDTKNESLSVESQRLILDKHIAELCIANAEILEFVDNGHSGTNFERPAVQELLELVRQGKVNCIIVKDLSRLGRNMIETGYYIERVFPLFRIRFIAISDNHDSAEHEGDTGGMDIAFKFLIHEQYSRDLSLKVKTAKRAKALRGELICKNCAFGFKKVDNRLEIDEPAAETVRLIFNMAVEGQNLAKIANRLYAEKHPTPSEYRKAKGKTPEEGFSCIWNKPVILAILHDEQYAGTYISGKQKRLEVGNEKSVRVDESEWIKIPNHHPAIISKEVYDAVNENIGKRPEPLRKRKLGTGERYKDITSLMKGKTYCGCCNHTMKLSSTRNTAFHCTYSISAPDAECYRLKMLGSELEAIALKQIRKQARAILKSVNSKASPQEAELEPQITEMDDAKCALYERFILREITADEYKAAKEELDAQIGRIKNAQAILTKDAAKKASIAGLQQAAECAIKAKALSQPIVDALIDRVRIYPDDRVEIVWKVENLVNNEKAGGLKTHGR